MEKYKPTEVSLSSFSYIFSELISYLWKHDEKNAEANLKQVGNDIGFRLYHMMAYKDKIYERQTRIYPLVKFVQTRVFKYIFGKEADAVGVFKHPTIENRSMYLISDSSPIILKYFTQRDQLNFTAFVAGIIESVLSSSGLECEVFAQTVTEGENHASKYPQTQYLITFTEDTERKYKAE